MNASTVVNRRKSSGPHSPTFKQRRPPLIIAKALDVDHKTEHSCSMQKLSVSSMPCAVEVTEIDNQTMANAGFRLIDQDLVRLQSAELKARQVIVRLEGCVVVYHTTNLRLRSRPSLPEHLLAFLTFGPQAIGTANGLPVRHDIMLAVPPANSLSLVSDPGYESIGILLEPDVVDAHLRVRDLEHSFQCPQRVDVLHVGGTLAGRLFESGKRLVESAVETPELFNTSEERRAAAQAELLDLLLTTLSKAIKVEPEKRERTRQLQSDIVNIAERYALANIDERLYVTDLCRATGVSERTLEYAFRAVMGLSPTAYLTRLRLHRVHHALLQAKPGSTTVTEQALNWGFWHFGGFSRAYKDCFDELPSSTLRRTSK
jgi:AraC family transcriptional regulator, ethanolamine operon transcriptional activator